MRDADLVQNEDKHMPWRNFYNEQISLWGRSSTGVVDLGVLQKNMLLTCWECWYSAKQVMK